ncbi:MAG: hypothetical protein ACREX4_03700, partial [Gammaproteobacteria bacterium]
RQRERKCPLSDEKRASRPVSSEIDSYARRTTIFDYLFRGSLSLFGWILTAFALSLGAPFWFYVLL